MWPPGVKRKHPANNRIRHQTATVSVRIHQNSPLTPSKSKSQKAQKHSQCQVWVRSLPLQWPSSVTSLVAATIQGHPCCSAGSIKSTKHPFIPIPIYPYIISFYIVIILYPSALVNKLPSTTETEAYARQEFLHIN